VIPQLAAARATWGAAAPVLKLGAVAVLLLGLVGGGAWAGCSWQANRDAGKLTDLRLKLNRSAYDLRAAHASLAGAAQALRAVNAEAAAKEARAASDKAADLERVRVARREAEAFRERLLRLEQAQQKAKRSPACKAQLEVTSCVSFE
jgi:hypothetical protein